MNFQILVASDPNDVRKAIEHIDEGLDFLREAHATIERLTDEVSDLEDEVRNLTRETENLQDEVSELQTQIESLPGE